MGVKTSRSLSRIAVVNILVVSKRWGRSGRLICVKQVSSVLRRRGFDIRGERGEDFFESFYLIGCRLLGRILLSEACHDSFDGRRGGRGSGAGVAGVGVSVVSGASYSSPEEEPSLLVAILLTLLC